jgi:hypothetical protein
VKLRNADGNGWPGPGREVLHKLKTSTSTITATQFGEICDRVWSDRASLLRGSGKLSGEATLVRAVFWRLCNAGIKTKGCAETDSSIPALLAYQSVVNQMLKASSRPSFDSVPILDALINRYQTEAGEGG